MITHEEFQTHLSGYIDGELSQTLREAMDSHVDTCEDCRVLLVTTQKSIELSRENAPKLSEAFQRDLTEKVKRAYRLGNRCEG